MKVQRPLFFANTYELLKNLQIEKFSFRTGILKRFFSSSLFVHSKSSPFVYVYLKIYSYLRMSEKIHIPQETTTDRCVCFQVKLTGLFRVSSLFEMLDRTSSFYFSTQLIVHLFTYMDICDIRILRQIYVGLKIFFNFILFIIT